jgi:glycosyltransferase involved in cell wall biosynthesis
MTGLPKVTIVIPVFNGGEYFELALQSALAQTYENIEIIVVNDGSTDRGKTEKIASKYRSQIKYIQQPNKGVASALNTAIASMTGEFFTWLSHDDQYLPEKTTAQVKYFQQLRKPNAILFSDYYLIDEQGSTTYEVKLDWHQYIQTPMLPLLRGSINGCTVFVPVHILREFGRFNENLRHVQDYDLWNKILQRYEFFLQPQTLIRYRVHAGQGTRAPAAAIEGDELWVRMMESRSETEQVQLSGSTKQFFIAMATFLDNTPYKAAARYAHKRARAAKDEAVVSVVMPFFNEVASVLRAAQSILGQSHSSLELVLVNDGSTEDMCPVEKLAESDSRVRLIHQENAGPGVARNRGVDAAIGSYIAFLDPRDQFDSRKIERQLAAMQDSGSLISHTSYHVAFPERFEELGRIDCGTFAGHVYPEILGHCPIETSTVMMHRSLASAGLQFSTSNDGISAWIWSAQRHWILGIDQPLSIIEWSPAGEPLNIDKSIRTMSSLSKELREDRVHGRHHDELLRLEQRLQELREWRLSGRSEGEVQMRAPLLNEALIDSVFKKVPSSTRDEFGVGPKGIHSTS